MASKARDVSSEPVRPSDWADGRGDYPSRWYEPEDTVDLLPYLRTLKLHWGGIAVATLLTVAVTGVLTAFAFPKWYRAEAVIRPIAQPAIQGRLAGMLGSVGGGLGGLGGAAGLLGAGGNSDAEEYIAILEGFRFSVALAKRHELEAELLKPGPLHFLTQWLGLKPGDVDWRIYRALKKRLAVSYSIKTGNITLQYQDKDRVQAQRVLLYYVDDLRDLLRRRAIEDASVAIKSMLAEAGATPDTLLQTQLYELIARQMQQRKLAEVEADFAFRVLDPPAASDKPYRPQVPLDCALAGFLVAFSYAFVILLKSAPYSGEERRVAAMARPVTRSQAASLAGETD